MTQNFLAVKMAVKSYGMTPEGYLTVKFNDGAELFIIPSANPSCKTLDSAFLFREGGELEAVVGAVDGTEEILFWGSAKQFVMAEYMRYVVKLGSMLHQARTEKRFKDHQWRDMGFDRIWKISQTGWQTNYALMKGKINQAEQLPDRFVQRLVDLSAYFEKEK